MKVFTALVFLVVVGLTLAATVDKMGTGNSEVTSGTGQVTSGTGNSQVTSGTGNTLMPSPYPVSSQHTRDARYYGYYGGYYGYPSYGYYWG
ncbi:unnamed protein product [Orchesella dallaii]|uniref:Uncharacterized protein n=1 Tax=Orchesella dallaii TaxID=48710 RepID=A0ABP1PP92_9HEXA